MDGNPNIRLTEKWHSCACCVAFLRIQWKKFSDTFKQQLRVKKCELILMLLNEEASAVFNETPEKFNIRCTNNFK